MTISEQQLEALVVKCRALGITHYRDDAIEIHLTDKPPKPVGKSPSPEAPEEVPGGQRIPARCPCGCAPWRCTGKAPCKSGCNYRKCHPVPSLEKQS